MNLFGGQKLFGTSTTTTSTTGFGGFTNFGLNTATQQPGLFQPAGTPAAPAGTGNLFTSFSTTVTPNAIQPFGSNLPKTTAPSLFSSPFSVPATNQSTNLFGTQNLGLGSTLQPAQPATGSIFTVPGVTQSTQLQHQQQQQQANTLDAFFSSLCQPLVFGDERDAILTRWNQLQAMWGTGIGYSSMGLTPYAPTNTFARFKTVAYNLLPTSTDTDGLVCMYLSKSFSEVSPQRQNLQDTLFRLISGGKPNLQLVIEEIRPCADHDSHTEVIIKVVERQATGTLTNINATELEAYLSGPTITPQLQSQLCVFKLTSEVCPSVAQLTAYKENPPAGIDRLLWQQACLDNPYPEQTIPVPVVGFTELRRRKLDQLAFSKQQSNVLQKVGDMVQEMKKGQFTMSQKIDQLKRKQLELSHRVLKVLRRQEEHRRSGFSISPQEEALRCGLERLWSGITSTRGLRSRFQEIQSTIQIVGTDTVADALNKENYAADGRHSCRLGSEGSSSLDELDSDTWAELKEYLSQRQTGIRELQHLINEMSATVKVIEDHPSLVLTAPSRASFGLPTRPSVNKVSFALNTLSR